MHLGLLGHNSEFSPAVTVIVRREETEVAPVIAPLPESLQQRCIAAPGLVAQVIVSKYCDHLPLYRQEQIYWDRHQVWLPRQSMARWVQLSSEWLKPIYREIKDQMMSGAYIQVDENAIRPTALGKKNRLFFGDANAGERSAVIYSIIESCRRHGVEPYTYLRDVLTRLPSMTNHQIKDIVPKAWAAARKTTALRAA